MPDWVRRFLYPLQRELDALKKIQSVNIRTIVFGAQDAYVASKFREGRDSSGRLSLHRSEERLEAIRGLPVFNTRSCETEAL
jgi:hypothetical protein